MKPDETPRIRLGDDGESPTLEEVARAIQEMGGDVTCIGVGEDVARALGLPGPGWYRATTDPRRVAWTRLDGTVIVVEGRLP